MADVMADVVGASMSDTRTLTLSDFLLARIAEDEAAARAAFRDQPAPEYRHPKVDDGRWSVGRHAMDEERIEGIGITIYDEGGHTAAQAAHIALHDPARVLAECEAKRRIVAFALTYRQRAGEETGSRKFIAEIMAETAEDALRPLALPYADHPDYRDEWKP